jgi:multisubunit Na+/H+ antiporter MnhB subunit
MRQKNWRLVIVGGVMVGLGIVFFLIMLSVAPQSTDPKALMEIVGQTSGVVMGLGVAVALIGYIGKKVA